MTTWIAAMSAIVLLNLLGTMALSVVVNQRIKRLEDDATRAYYRDRALSDAISNLNKRMNHHLGLTPSEAPNAEEASRIDELLRDYPPRGKQ